MAEKKPVKQVKLVIPAGKATPAPPVGPALGQAGINIGEFVTKFNTATSKMAGEVVPVIISVYQDRSFDFILKTSPASNLLLKSLGQEKGSGRPNTKKIGKITQAQLREVAEKKLSDLNTTDVDQAMKIIAGSARSMGIEVVK